MKSIAWAIILAAVLMVPASSTDKKDRDVKAIIVLILFIGFMVSLAF